MLVKVNDTPRFRAMSDLLEVYYSPDLYINQKGYFQKLIDLLYNFGYYDDNKSIFQNRSDK